MLHNPFLKKTDRKEFNQCNSVVMYNLWPYMTNQERREILSVGTISALMFARIGENDNQTIGEMVGMM